MQSADPKIGFALETNKDKQIRKLKKTLKDKLKKYVDAMKKTQAQATAAMEGVDEATAAAAANEISLMLNRVNIFLVLFYQVMSRLGDRSGQEAFNLKTCVGDIEQALEDGELMDETVRFSELCDLYEAHFPVHDTLFSLAAACRGSRSRRGVARSRGCHLPPLRRRRRRLRARRPLPPRLLPERRRAPGPPRAPRRPPRAAASRLRGRDRARRSRRGRPLQRLRPRPLASPPRPRACRPRPLVPTQAGAGEERRAAPSRARGQRGGSESVTNSLFENMFKPAGTDASAEEQQPASPTPSSGSEGPSGGPRTFQTPALRRAR